MKRLLRHALVLSLAVVLLLCVGTGTASARTMKIFHDMDSYVAGKMITIMWYNNVEGADHYDCTVLNTTTGDYVRPRSTSSSGYDAYVSGSKVKAGEYKVWVGAVAADGTTLDQGVIYFTVNEASSCDHRWSSRTGCCTRCDEECPHNSGLIEVVTKTVGTSISSTQHKIVTTYDEECKNCRYAINEDKTRTEKGSHRFDSNGDCQLCDYRAACKHSSTELEETSRSYSQYNDTYHSVKTVSSKICANANCGKVIERGIIDTFKEKHSMSGDKCTKCGYAKTYDPLSVSISRNSASAYTGSTIGASCSASGGTGKYNYYWYVYRDGSEIYSTSSWDTRGSYTASQEGKYTFKVLVEDKTTKEQKSATSGAITVTKAPCQHPATRKVQEGSLKYTKISESKHSVRTDWADVCTTCSATVSTYYSTSEEAHTYVGGSCKFCGSAEPVKVCDHATKTSSELSRKYRASTSDTQHFVDITWEDRCANKACGVVLNKTRVTTEKENHTFSGDVCSRCGYARVSEKGCDHASQKKTQLSRSVKPYDVDFHAVTTTYKITCANASCGEVLSNSKTETTYERHSMSGNTCSTCGYKAACSHPNEKKTSIGATTYETGDAQSHFAVTSYTISCTDCGATLNGNYVERVSFRHTMENGRCKYCGYQAGCSHTNEKKTSNGATRYETGDALAHFAVTSYTVSCADCGKILDANYTERVSFRHTMENGGCKHCGYKASVCSHENQEKTANGAAHYEIGGVDYHFTVTSYTVSCADCGEIISADWIEAVSFDHTMENGRCKHCGYSDAAAVEPSRELESTRLVNETTEMHKVIETWRVTHADGTVTTEEVARFENHKAKRTGVEAKHPHKQFIVCECGARPYTGKERTLDSCAICNPVPAEPVKRDCRETGIHEYSAITYAKEHPHRAEYATCACGAVSYDVPADLLGESLTCCKCGYHNFAGAIPNGSYYNYYCACGYSVTTVAPAEDRMYETFVEMDNVIWKHDPFRVIGGEAIGKLTEGGYVYINESVNATKDPGAAITGAVVELFDDDYHTQQVEKWEYLIMQMLLRNPEYGYGGETRDLEAVYNTQDAAGFVDDALSNYENLGEIGCFKTVDDWIEQYDNVITSLMKNKDTLQKAIDTGKATEEQVRQWNQVTDQIEKMSDTRTTLAEASEVGKGVGDAAKLIDVAVSGFTAFDNTSKLYNGYRELAALYSVNQAKLDSIIASAEAIGYKDVADAARNVKNTMDEQATLTVGQMNTLIALESAVEFGGDVAIDAAGELLGEALEAAAPPLKIVGAVGSAADFVMGWGDSYESAQTLMMLRDMDNQLGMEVQTILRDDPDNGRYLAELYLVLQIEGLDQTKEFLEDYEDARGLSVSEFNVHDLDEYMDYIDDSIDRRVLQNAALYSQYQQYKKQSSVVITGAKAILRKGPSINSDYVFTAYQGMTFDYLDREDSWYKILYDGKVAYVSVSKVQ